MQISRNTYFILSLMIATTYSAIFTEEQEASVIELIESVLECRNIPGFTVSIVHGKQVWAKGFGEADIDSGRRVQNDTLFSIGSLGKGFTMALLGVLLQGTSYTWSTKLADIDGVDVTFVSENLTREATLGDLLSHQTGLWDLTDFGFIAGYPEGTTMQCISNRLPLLPQKDNLREGDFLYNNMMYMVLGHVIEVLGQDSWHNLMTSLILEPLEMVSSRTMKCADDVYVGNVAKPYIMPGNTFLNGTQDLYMIKPFEPAGGIMSNAIDMAKWLQFNLNNGADENGEQILESELLAEAFKAQKTLSLIKSKTYSKSDPPFPINDTTTAYGYAWFTSEYRGKRKIWHSGGLFSYISLQWLFPDQDIGIFASLNGPCVPHTTGNAPYVVLSYIADILLGLEPWLDKESACTFPAPWSVSFPWNVPNMTEYTNDHLEDFIGVYGNRLLPDIRIEVTGNDDNKKLRLNWNRIMGDLLPSPSNDTFNFKMTDPWEYAIEFYLAPNLPITFPVNFKRTENGEVDSFEFQLRAGVPMLYEKGITFIDDCDTETDAAKELWSCDNESEESDDVNLSVRHKMSVYLLLFSVLLGLSQLS